MRLADKVAIVTGAGRGIGKAIARKLVEEGAKVVICDIDEELAQATAQEINESFPQSAVALKVDVANGESVNQMVERTLEMFGKIDILVNNAGITRDALLLRMSEEDWDRVLNVNLKSVFLCTKAVAKHMMRQRYGRIVNISSVIALRGNVGQTNYGASKAGIIGFTKSAARELAGRNITVNAVAPGFISTEMTAKLPQEARDKMLAQIPMERAGEPEDVANVVAFLCSDEASYITGEVIRVDGGMAI